MTNKKNTNNFETAIAQLEQIIENIEGNQVDLEDSLNQYKEGMALIKFCQDKLREVEQSIKILDQETNKLKDFNVDPNVGSK